MGKGQRYWGGDGREKKVLKKWKNLLDKGRWGWYYVEAVREDKASETKKPWGSEKDFEKSRKKFLTKGGRRGKMWNRRGKQRATAKAKRERKSLKKLEKSSWQELEDVVRYETVAVSAVHSESWAENKKFEKLEKSSWQSENDVVKFKTVATATSPQKNLRRHKRVKKLEKVLDKGLKVW